MTAAIGPAAVHGLEHARGAVVLDDVREGAELLLEPGLDDLGPVVVALDQGRAVDVADPGTRGG